MPFEQAKSEGGLRGHRMTEKIKNVGRKLEETADRILLFLCIPVFCGFAYYSARYTVIETDGIPATAPDSVLRNLIVLTAVTAFAFLLYEASRKERLQPLRKRLRAWRPYLVAAAAALVYLISVIWVLECHIIPGGDGEALCYAAHRMITGNFVDMKEMGYMTFFPHQYSLLSVIHGIFSLFGVWKYQVFQHINALCMPLLFYSGYKILQMLCDSMEAVIYYILFFLGCLPLFFYVPLVYGEIISFTFTAVLMWQTARYCKTGSKSCFLWGTAAIVIACMVRKNSLIVLIAVGIVLFIHSVREAKIRGLIWLLVMFLTVSGTDRLIHAYYERISGIEISEGIPYVSWIRMGMQDAWTGPGWFDNSSVEAFTEHGFDTEETARAEKKLLGQILKDMWGDKAFGIDFFRRKILSQWNSPVYYYEYETKRFDCDPGVLPALPRYLYFEGRSKVQNFMNRYQFVLYFYAALSAVILFADRKKERHLEEHILYIAIFGGVLFSALWEAGSRYVLPYVVYMIPLAAMGMCRLTKLSEKRRLLKPIPADLQKADDQSE